MGPMPQTDSNTLPNGTPAPLQSGNPSEGGNQNYSGRVAALAVANQSATLYAGTARGGVWRTVLSPGTSGYSVSWQSLDNIEGNNLPPGLNNIGAITVDPTNPQRVYAGTGEANYSSDQGTGAGILVSDNGGNSWKLVQGSDDNAQAFVGESIAKIIVDPISSVAGLSRPGALMYAVGYGDGSAANSCRLGPREKETVPDS